jgi:hypothetical protein
MQRAMFGILFLLAAVPLTAQDTSGPRFELGVGMLDGWTRGPTTPALRLTYPGLYGDVAVTDRLVLSTSVYGFVIGDGVEAARVRADARWLFRGTAQITPYVFGGGITEYHAETSYRDRLLFNAVGGGAGIRFPLAKRLAISVELGYHRWIETERDQVGVGIRVGVPFGRR